MAEASLKTLAKGAGILALGTFLSKLIMYFYRILVARQDIGLGPEGYGLLSLGLSVFWISMTFAHLGVGSGIQRRVSDYMGRGEEEKISRVMWTSMAITVPWSVVIAAAVFFLAEPISVQFFKDPSLSPVLRVFALAIPFQVLYKNGVSLVQAFKEMQYVAYVDKIFRSLATLIFTAVLLYFGYGLIGAVYAQLGAIFFSSILILYFAERKVYPFLRTNVDVSRERAWMLGYSWPLFLSGIIGLAVGWTDTVLLGFFEASEKVGIYNAALPTAQVLNVVQMSMAATLFPTVSEMYGRGEKQESISITATAIKWMAMAALPAAVLMVLFAGPILRLLFGGVYVGASAALALLGTAYFIQTMTSHASSFIKSEEWTKLSFFNSAVVATVNVVLNLILIPMYSATGAAAATTISMTLGAVLATGEAYFLFGVQPYRFRSFVPSVAATAVSGGVVYIILHSIYKTIPVWVLFPAFAAFGTLYVALYLLFGGIDDDDMEVLRAIDRRTDADLEPLKKVFRRLNR